MGSTFEEAKLVTVYGGTGAQGRSLVRSLLQNKGFKVRAVTRDSSSKRAQELASWGVEIAVADGWKKDQITAAFNGSWAAFVNTNSDDPIFAESESPTEFDLGKIIIDGIVDAGTVEHFIYSGAASTADATNGEVVTKTTDMKTKIERYAAATGSFKSVVPVYAGWYMENFANIHFSTAFGGFPTQTDKDGFITLATPRWGTATDMPVPWISIEKDFGDIVHGVLCAPEEYNGKIVAALSDTSTLPATANALETVIDKDVRYVCLPSPGDLAPEVPQLADVRALYKYGQLSDAKYFGLNTRTTTRTSAFLKARAAEACGKDPKQANLLSFKDWLSDFFQQGPEKKSVGNFLEGTGP